MFSRLSQYWVYGGSLAGILLLILLPELARDWSPALFGVFLQLPVYMLHQLEEHDNDRFREFVNRRIGGGKQVLSPLDVFVINVPGVWGVNTLSFYLCAHVAVGYGLIAVDLTLLNAIIHIIFSLVFRMYNPGQLTALLLFLPAGGYAFCELQRTGEMTWTRHLLAILVAIGIHLAIIAYVQINKRRLA